MIMMMLMMMNDDDVIGGDASMLYLLRDLTHLTFGSEDFSRLLPNQVPPFCQGGASSIGACKHRGQGSQLHVLSVPKLALSSGGLVVAEIGPTSFPLSIGDLKDF